MNRNFQRSMFLFGAFAALAFCPPQASNSTPPADDRKVAEWVIAMRGHVVVEGRNEAIKTVMDLGSDPITITNVDFWYTKDIRDDDLEKLKDLKKLNFLRFVGTPLTGAGFKHLAGMKSLRFIDANSSKINNEGIQHLVEIPELHNLWIGCPDVNDSSIEHLVKITSLQGLALVNTKLTDVGLARLAQLPNLKALNVDKTKVTANGIEEFKKARPDVNIQWTPPPPYISPTLPRPLPAPPSMIPAEKHAALLDQQLKTYGDEWYQPGSIQAVDEVVDRAGKKYVGKVLEYGTSVVVITNAGKHIFNAGDVSVERKRRREEMVKPDLSDLDVTHMERTPRMLSNHGNVDYRDKLPFLRVANPDLAFPPAGTEVTFTAHVVNKGTKPTGEFHYEFFLDDQSIGAGKLASLAPTAEITAAANWIWEDGPHTIQCIVTSSVDAREISLRNNQLCDRTDAFGFLFCITKESLDDFNSVPNVVDSFSIEDYVQYHFEVMNRLFAESVYPAAPNGCLARIRVDKFLYPSAATFEEEKRTAGRDGHESGFYYQGTWQFEKQHPFDPAYMFRVDWGLLHEMGHQLGLIDEYHWYSHMHGPVAIKLDDRFLRVTHRYSQWQTMMDSHGPHRFSSIATLALNAHWGRPFGDYGEYLYAFPETCQLQILDREGRGVDGATVSFYQRREPNSTFEDPPVSTATSDNDGVLTIPNQDAPLHEGVSGFQLKPNPAGHVRVTGQSSYFLAKIQFQEFVEWHWIELVDYNVAALAGQSGYRKILDTQFPGAEAPAPPQGLRASYRDWKTVDLEFDAVEGASSYWLYGKEGFQGWREQPFKKIQELKSPRLIGLNVESGPTFLAVTTVDSRGIESGLSKSAYCRRVIHCTNVAIASEGTRFLVDTHDGGVLRQRPDGTIDDWSLMADMGAFCSGVAILSNQTIAASNPNSQVYLFRLDGSLLKNLGGVGTADNQFNGPADIAADRFDNVYVADTGNHRIQMFNKELQFQESLQDGFKEPRGVHVTKDTRLIVADTGNNRVVVYNRRDKQWKQALTINKLQKPWDVATDSKGRIIISEQDAQAVSIYDDRGKRVRVYDQLGPVHGIAVNPDDTILVASPEQIIHTLR